MTTRLWARLLLAGLLLALGVGAATAQEQEGEDTLTLLLETSIPARDVYDLAARYQGWDGNFAPNDAPIYYVGDLDNFRVRNVNDNEYRQLSAELLAATPGVYMWVEAGVGVDQGLALEAAARLDDDIFPAVRDLLGEEPLPGIDGDEHVYLLHALDLGQTLGYFSSEHGLPVELAPFSNQREMATVNLSILGPGDTLKT